jgi:WXG100 family type VII secretion target
MNMAGSGELLAKIAEMRTAADAIGGSAERVNQAVDAVDVEIKALGPDRFSGAASDAFRAEYNRLTPALREAYEDLVQFKQKLIESADDIERASKPA